MFRASYNKGTTIIAHVPSGVNSSLKTHLKPARSGQKSQPKIELGRIDLLILVFLEAKARVILRRR